MSLNTFNQDQLNALNYFINSSIEKINNEYNELKPDKERGNLFDIECLIIKACINFENGINLIKEKYVTNSDWVSQDQNINRYFSTNLDLSNVSIDDIINTNYYKFKDDGLFKETDPKVTENFTEEDWKHYKKEPIVIKNSIVGIALGLYLKVTAYSNNKNIYRYNITNLIKSLKDIVSEELYNIFIGFLILDDTISDETFEKVYKYFIKLEFKNDFRIALAFKREILRYAAFKISYNGSLKFNDLECLLNVNNAINSFTENARFNFNRYIAELNLFLSIIENSPNYIAPINRLEKFNILLDQTLSEIDIPEQCDLPKSSSKVDKLSENITDLSNLLVSLYALIIFDDDETERNNNILKLKKFTEEQITKIYGVEHFSKRVFKSFLTDKYNGDLNLKHMKNIIKFLDENDKKHNDILEIYKKELSNKII